MNVLLTKAQAVSLRLEQNREFVRAAFYTGHSLVTISELLSADVYAAERGEIIKLAYSLGMNDEDTVGVANVSS